MKILALSDEVLDQVYSPQIRQRYGEADFVVGCGDLPFYYLEFVVTMLNVPVYYVPGNHDRPEQYHSDGRVARWAEGCELVDGRTVRHRSSRAGTPEVLLAGLGGCLRYNANPYHQYTQIQMMQRALSLVPALAANRASTGRYLDILITHAPPRGIHDTPDRAHTGFDAFLWLMRLFRPRLLLHGHAHIYRQDAVTRTHHLSTQVINIYPQQWVELETGSGA